MQKPKRLKLSARMNLFLDLALPNCSFWDLCCDHGYVGLGALVLFNKEKSFTSVNFVDQIPHVMKILEERIDQLYHRPDIPYTLYSLPAEELDVDLTGTVLIAGVGGLTTKNILSGLLKKNKLKAQRILLSPHTDIKTIEDYFLFDEFKNNYYLKEKMIIAVGKKDKPFYILDSLDER